MKKHIVVTLICVMSISFNYSFAAHDHKESVNTNEPAYVMLGGTGTKNKINDDLYFTYDFDKKPAMGMLIVIIQVYDKKGGKVTSLAVTGASGMPSMGGAHDSGDMSFRLNKKGKYLLPVNVVMPGDWEVKIRFKKGNTIIYSGKIRFDV